MRTRRATFRRRKNYDRNDAIQSRHANQRSAARMAVLHDPKRKRSDGEMLILQLAAARRPGGWAAEFLSSLAPKRRRKSAAV